MLRFLKRLFGLKNEAKNPEGIVRKIKVPEKTSTPNYHLKKMENKREEFFYILRSDIEKMGDDNKGMITSIKLKPQKGLTKIEYKDAPKVVETKKGLSKILIDVTLPLDENNSTQYKHLSDLKMLDKGVCVFRIDKFNNCYLLGEHNGLKIVDLNKKKIVFEGEENDAFHRVLFQALKKLLHS